MCVQVVVWQKLFYHIHILNSQGIEYRHSGEIIFHAGEEYYFLVLQVVYKNSVFPQFEQ